MDMSWQALLQEAAATSFEKTADTLAAAENDNCACIDLHQQQIHELSKKILLLPHQGRVLLLSRYCFRLSPEETEMFFHLENAKGRFRFYKELLSSSMGVEAGCMIPDDTFVKACHIALKGYLHNELEEDADDEAAGNNRTHIAFRKVWKTVAVAAITLTLLFSTCMVANAQFRERVISWVIETFEKYSIFELHGDELDEPQDLTEYQAGYLPDGAILQDTTKQPNTEPGIVLYEYAINEVESFEIMITQSDNRVYFDTENTKIYLTTWFSMIYLLAIWHGETYSFLDMFSSYIRYLLSFFLLANISEMLKRTKNKMLSTMPFISAYLLLLIDEQVIQSVTNRNGITIRLIFSWTFQPLGLVLLPIFLAITTLLLLQLNRTYDIF